MKNKILKRNLQKKILWKKYRRWDEFSWRKQKDCRWNEFWLEFNFSWKNEKKKTIGLPDKKKIEKSWKIRSKKTHKKNRRFILAIEVYKNLFFT